jgi:hypothetical protein
MQRAALTRLQTAFELLAPRAAELTVLDLSMLRCQVFAAVDELRAVGVPALGIIVVVNDLAADTGVPLQEHDVFAQLVMWCVDRYYG